MNIAILGFSAQGESAYKHWNKPENDLTICDSREDLELPESAEKQLGKDYLKNLDRFDLIIRGAPSIHPKSIKEANPESPEILDKVWSNTNELLKICPSKNTIGVTGTKGKGTTSSLIADILSKAGYRVHLGGNIGTPPLDMLKEEIRPDHWVVLELANFQLIDIKYSPYIAVCLMVVPEHMDWHTDMDEYMNAKKQLFAHQIEKDTAVYNANNKNSESIVSSTRASKRAYDVPEEDHEPGNTEWGHVKDDAVFVGDTEICKTSEVALLGGHNLQNVCAALTAVWGIDGVNADVARESITTFKGLEYRLEFVREVKGASYYNDSFGTTPETALVAVKAFESPKVVILGGSDKGSNYEELAKTVAENNVKKVLLIGNMADKIKQALDEAGYKDYMNGGKDMKEIVENARNIAEAGDVVILSPACASFDMFKNYKDRGDKFKEAVQELA